MRRGEAPQVRRSSHSNAATDGCSTRNRRKAAADAQIAAIAGGGDGDPGDCCGGVWWVGIGPARTSSFLNIVRAEESFPKRDIFNEQLRKPRTWVCFSKVSFFHFLNWTHNGPGPDPLFMLGRSRWVHGDILLFKAHYLISGLFVGPNRPIKANKGGANREAWTTSSSALL